MKRRSRAGSVKTRGRNRAAPKRASGTEAARPRSSSAASQGPRLAQLARERDQALEQFSAASEVLQVISSSPGDLKPVFETILEKATRICGADYGSLLLYEEDAFHAVAHHNMPPEIIEKRRREPLLRPGPASSLTRVAKTKEVVQIPDITADQGYLERNPERKALLEFGGYRSILTVPILKEKELIGGERLVCSMTNRLH